MRLFDRYESVIPTGHSNSLSLLLVDINKFSIDPKLCSSCIVGWETHDQPTAN